jgi:opacity protein-like surface antigen
VGGINAGLVVGNNAYIDNEYGVQNIGRTQDISTVNVSGTVGVGLNYALGKNLSVAVEPRLNYYLNSINRNPEVDFRPYRVGVYTGLYYEF